MEHPARRETGAEDAGRAARKAAGLEATNRDFLRHEQVEKRQAYRLAEGGVEAFDEETEIRTCDMAPLLAGEPGAEERFAAELGRALEEIGFAILAGHGVDPAVHEEAERGVERLFGEHDEVKRRFLARRHGAVNQGWFPLEETSEIHPDLVEGWVFARRAFDLEGEPSALEDFWPDPALEPVFRRLYLAQEPLVLPIARSILRYLGLDPGLLDERLARPAFALRLNRYPPVPPGADPRAGRLLGHEDVDLFTLLPAPRSEGLQVLNRRGFRWIRLDAPPGTIVLNTGDYMQRLTNDRLPSTTHRVSQPRDPALRARARVSFPMNVYLRDDETLEVLPGLGPPRYPPIDVLRFHTRTTAKYYGEGYAVDDGPPAGGPGPERAARENG